MQKKLYINYELCCKKPNLCLEILLNKLPLCRFSQKRCGKPYIYLHKVGQ